LDRWNCFAILWDFRDWVRQYLNLTCKNHSEHGNLDFSRSFGYFSPKLTQIPAFVGTFFENL
jgi:hypothetical protein